jgi:polysaccharide export outer membrane protein
MLAFVGAGVAGRTVASEGPAYTLGPGDKIHVTVFGYEDLSGDFEIDGRGDVSLPLIRNVHAQGLTTSDLEQVIAERLSPDYLKDPKVSVGIVSYRPFFIYGQVVKPGSYPYVNNMTVHHAVALAGGFTYRARTSTVRLRRNVDGNKTEQDVPLDTDILPGDVIEVRERYF